MSKVIMEEKKGFHRALFFNTKYGMVFGQGDLIINFDDISKCSSKLGQTFSIPVGTKEGQLPNKADQLKLTNCKDYQFGADIVELEVYSMREIQQP